MMNGVLKRAGQVVEALKDRGLFITTVESCTGGGLVNALTNIPGASEVLTSARVAYSAEEKVAIGVPEPLTIGASVYSTETAIAMARSGIKEAVRADVGVGITGRIHAPELDGNSEVFVVVVMGEQVVHRKVALQPMEHRLNAKETIIEESLQMVLELVLES